tara:strand:- start:854 stop:1939 length:1086 start_codon:yes stop_codon:yes gene_type:complete
MAFKMKGSSFYGKKISYGKKSPMKAQNHPHSDHHAKKKGKREFDIKDIDRKQTWGKEIQERKSPMKVAGSFVDGERVSFEDALAARKEGKKNVEFTNLDAKKFAETGEAGEHSGKKWLDKTRQKGRQEISKMSKKDRDEHRRLVKEDRRRQEIVDAGGELTEEEKANEVGRGAEQNVFKKGITPGSYEFHGKEEDSPAAYKKSPMKDSGTRHFRSEKSWMGDRFQEFADSHDKAYGYGHSNEAHGMGQNPTEQDKKDWKNRTERDRKQRADERNSPAKDLGHGGHKGLSKEEAAKRTHGGKMSARDKARRMKKYVSNKAKGGVKKVKEAVKEHGPRIAADVATGGMYSVGKKISKHLKDKK